jgi:N-acetylneuraminic acid mutarotase
VYDEATGAWTPTGSLATRRELHTATLLASGKVLVVGGADGAGGEVTSAELYDEATGTWMTKGSLATARERHTATLLASGKVLVAGGFGVGFFALASAELYDETTGTWTTTGSLATPRGDHTATLLPSRMTGSLASAELYNEATGTWTPTGSLFIERDRHTATQLPSGEVLVAGGFTSRSQTHALDTAELYDEATGTWITEGSLATARFWHRATLLRSGKVLVTGGDGMGFVPLASAELRE